MKKRIIATILAIGLTLSAFPILSAGAEDGDGFEVIESTSFSSRTVGARTIPDGAYGINLNVNGRSVLQGRVFNLGGITYVPMFAFADWLGNFTYSFNSTTATARVDGENLEITAHAGDLYITANDRYFYTGREVILVNGEIFVPILPMTKALNSRVSGEIPWTDFT